MKNYEVKILCKDSKEFTTTVKSTCRSGAIFRALESTRYITDYHNGVEVIEIL